MNQAEDNCLARAIYFQMKDKPERIQSEFAAFILARVKSQDYPNSICGVVYQGTEVRDACQFRFACDGEPDDVTNQNQWMYPRKLQIGSRGEFQLYKGGLQEFSSVEVDVSDLEMLLSDPPSKKQSDHLRAMN